MNLGDYIGDTRTESLPPGFLRSIKIKYKHEASHVFAGLPPCSPQYEVAKQSGSVVERSQQGRDENEDGERKEDEENGKQNLPSFMSWRVPSRLLNQNNEKTLSIDEGDQNVKAKSASIISRRTTAQERAVTSVHSNRSRKTAEQTKPGVRNPRQINQSKGRDDGSSKNSAKSSTRSKYENVENEKKDDHVKSANSKILKPIIEKPNKDHGTALKAKIFVFNEAEAQENVKNSSEDKTKISKNHKDESSNAKITENEAMLPMIKPPESRTSIKLSQTPERMEKIYDWVKKSTGRERKAAFNLLSVYNKSEDTQAKTPRKKERVRLALQMLERRKIPDAVKPFQLTDIRRNPTVMKRDEPRTSANNSNGDKMKRNGMHTWHRIPMYRNINPSNNKSALFVQPLKPYQRHFSIHPEWGLHTRVKFANSVAT